MDSLERNRLVSILIPCLNEEEAIGSCLIEIKKVLEENKISAEVIVIDNGSTDGSRAIIEEFKKSLPSLILLDEPEKGYGRAYLKGLEHASGEYIFMADGDGSYDFDDLPKFILELETGADLVIGNRFLKMMEKRSMPWHHKHIGNPFLSTLARLLFDTKVSDMLCGMRAVKKSALEIIKLQTAGMEFSAEMVVKSAKKNLVIRELPTLYKKRSGESKLRSFADGWRYVRFILLYSPFALFFVPGILLFGMGVIFMALMYFTNLNLFGIPVVIHPILLFSLMMIVGYQLTIFSGFAKTYALTHLGDSDPNIEKILSKITIEKASITGLMLALLGAILYLIIFMKWLGSGLGTLDEIKNGVVGLTLLVLGVQTIFSAFMISILGIKEK